MQEEEGDVVMMTMAGFQEGGGKMSEDSRRVPVHRLDTAMGEDGEAEVEGQEGEEEILV